MDSIKSDSYLPGESSFNKMNQKDVFQVPKNLDTVESNSQKNPIDDLPWIVDGLAFPKGTEFRGQYKGYVYYGKVNSGALMMNGKAFSSPCAAAMTITRSAVDGWLFWDCKPPGASTWIDIHTLKQMK
jgi:hypothetical protein